MQLLPNQDVDPVIKRLDQAVEYHRRWLKHLLRTVICDLVHLDEDKRPDAHTRCEFGQWYYSEETEFLKDNDAFKNIEKLHEGMHEIAANMLLLKESNQTISPSEFNDFSHYVDAFTAEVEKLKELLQKLHYNRDPLTGAYNRATLKDELHQVREMVSRKVCTAYVVMMDIDFFKSVNDSYGHAFGDLVLKRITEFVQTHLRVFDKFFRIGGEEFLLTLINMDVDSATVLTERIRKGLAELVIKDNDQHSVLITASFGIAEVQADMDMDECLKRADQAMYHAKHNGRNRTEVWHSDS